MRVVQFFNDENKKDLFLLDQNVKDRLLYIEKEYNKGADWWAF